MDVILGTAGHIDHGKTTLVRALTGINCDRLEEEKRRGITIELGFAWLDLPDGRRIGIVDVPGHERFVKNMVAGASGIDCVLLVIAADEGIMPQTREHLEICSLLGVRTGLVALTKADLVDKEWLNMVREEIKLALDGTFLENAPIVPVSAVTGEGLDELRNEMIIQLSRLQKCTKTDIFRLPIDRVFTMKGFGAVATGTIISGRCQQGEKLCLMPFGQEFRARSLQTHNEQVETAHEGQRCAVNMQGLDVADAQRGEIIARPDTLFTSTSWFARLYCLKSSPLPIRQRGEVHFHHGTSECLAKIIFHDRDILNAGDSSIAEIKFKSPMTAIYGDHCVIRAHSPLRAIAGGVVINPLPPHLIRRQTVYQEKLELLQKLGEAEKNNPTSLIPKDPVTLTEICLELCDVPGTSFRKLQVMTGLTKHALKNALEILAQNKKVWCWDSVENEWISQKELQNCLTSCRQRAEKLHENEPLKSFFTAEELTEGWGKDLPKKFTQEILNLAIKNGILEIAGAGLKLAEHKINFNNKEARILEILQKEIKTGGTTPPFIRELIDKYDWNLKEILPLLNHLCHSGSFLKIQEGVYYDTEVFNLIIDKIKHWFDKNNDLDINNIKEILGISRKYAIPLLEYLDSIHVTFRVGNKRRLCGK